MTFASEELEEALNLLGEILSTQKSSEYWAVVCGGSSLLALGLIQRPTRDVDILALRDIEGAIDRVYPLPSDLGKAAAKVADELGLADNWLNSASSLHFPDLNSLPNSFWTGLETREFGSHLKMSFVERKGLLLLKFYAALNRAEQRDLDDLASLAPGVGETERALDWVTTAFSELSNKGRLPQILRLLGHEQLLSRFKK